MLISVPRAFSAFSFSASNLMVDYPPENLLYGPYAMSLDEAAIQDYAKQLLPDNLQVCACANSNFIA